MYISFVPLLLLLSAPIIHAAWPNGPLVTSGRWIHNSLGENVTYAGVNWPGASEAMIPEGLQYASISSIVSGIKSLGMNVIRLTFAIELVDDILDNGGDVKLSDAFTKALGTESGPVVWGKVKSMNPELGDNTTRLQVYDAIAAECARQEIYVHLDNHMSQAAWCCGTGDGNAWFGDTYFDVEKWKRGLTFMATHGAQWPNLMSIGMRNELRTPSDNSTLASTTYNWSVWYKYMTAASQLINTANPSILIFFSGLDYDTTLAPITSGTDLGNGIFFQKSNFSYADKIVLEIHNYATTTTNCEALKSDLKGKGFNTLDAGEEKAFPLVMTEWGHDQTDGSYANVYATCLGSYLPSVKVGMIWVIAGSYYIRSGTQDFEETWGLYNHNWTAWRDDDAIASLKTMVDLTLTS